ncbi:TatD family nuclease-associated radical SAM protein [Sulfuriflexus mobilis]|uniref:TatD family nuclease-associated radical SAM protein n=1 Tax=Sulfuriflexus mobilis TaxID=1811807 RepID=UPI000F839D70|nr:TatD family nuclease-associated radical SAM protein [Sulfuriflexus mobilis]
MSDSTQSTHTADVVAYTLHGNRYLNITNRCSLRCRFCPKFNKVWDVQDYSLRLHHEPDVEEILVAVGDPAAYKEIVFCGLGEPTQRLDTLLAVAARLHEQGARLRLNTDGMANLVYGRDVTPQLGGVIDAVSISLNAHNAELYEQHCRPQYPDAFAGMLDFTCCARRHIAEVTLTAIDGLEGVDISACEAIAADLGVAFRRRVLDVVG